MHEGDMKKKWVSLTVIAGLFPASAHSQTTYAPCPEMQNFMDRNPPFVRQMMAINDELGPTLSRIQERCSQRAMAAKTTARRTKMGKKAADAEDREIRLKSSDRGEYADLGQN